MYKVGVVSTLTSIEVKCSSLAISSNTNMLLHKMQEQSKS